jgi:hypothetical protein
MIRINSDPDPKMIRINSDPDPQHWLHTHTDSFICLYDSGEYASTVGGWVHSETIAVSSPFLVFFSNIFFFFKEMKPLLPFLLPV